MSNKRRTGEEIFAIKSAEKARLSERRKSLSQLHSSPATKKLLQEYDLQRVGRLEDLTANMDIIKKLHFRDRSVTEGSVHSPLNKDYDMSEIDIEKDMIIIDSPNTVEKKRKLQSAANSLPRIRRNDAKLSLTSNFNTLKNGPQITPPPSNNNVKSKTPEPQLSFVKSKVTHISEKVSKSEAFFTNPSAYSSKKNAVTEFEEEAKRKTNRKPSTRSTLKFLKKAYTEDKDVHIVAKNHNSLSTNKRMEKGEKKEFVYRRIKDEEITEIINSHPMKELENTTKEKYMEVLELEYASKMKSLELIVIQNNLKKAEIEFKDLEISSKNKEIEAQQLELKLLNNLLKEKNKQHQEASKQLLDAQYTTSILQTTLEKKSNEIQEKNNLISQISTEFKDKKDSELSRLQSELTKKNLVLEQTEIIVANSLKQNEKLEKELNQLKTFLNSFISKLHDQLDFIEFEEIPTDLDNPPN